MRSQDDPSVIDTGAKFLRAIKTVTHEDHDADAVEFLDGQMRDFIAGMREKSWSWTRKVAVAFYQGAFFGLKLAARRNKIAAEARAFEMGIDIHTGQPLKSREN